ncbi:MAG: hypothetical protein U1A77_23350 [Pirellulales bacterium]
MRVSVELFGIPRRRAGTARIDIDLPGATAEIAEVLLRLVELYPALANDCLNVAARDGTHDALQLTKDKSPDAAHPLNLSMHSSPPLCRLAEHCLMQVRDVFTREVTERVADGERILLLSADAGG